MELFYVNEYEIHYERILERHNNPTNDFVWKDSN